jgi:hypothetical protein
MIEFTLRLKENIKNKEIIDLFTKLEAANKLEKFVVPLVMEKYKEEKKYWDKEIEKFVLNKLLPSFRKREKQ